MNWSYVMVFNDSLGSRKEVTDYLDTIPEVSFWYAFIPHSIFITCSLTAGSLAERMFQRFGKKEPQRFFISEVANDRQGWAPKQLWHMLKNPDDPNLKDE